jgi:murein DD-endopeptidase MepM/ murein hydrolase activator NlpD
VSPFGAPRTDRRHAGLDIAGRQGQPVLAALAGRVVRIDPALGGYGKTVVIDHGDGLRTLYAHNSSLLVQEGQWVERAQPVALVGRSGNATTDHCHFEVQRWGTAIDPLPHLERDAERSH